MAELSQSEQNEDCLKKRRTFCHFLAGLAPTSPNIDLPRLCDAWHSLTDADWVWFWLFNDLTKQWQLLAASPQNDRSVIPDTLSVSAKNSVNEYIHNTGKPISVPDLQVWQADHNGGTYKVAFSDILYI